MTVKQRVGEAVKMEAVDMIDTMRYLLHEWATVWNHTTTAPRVEVWECNSGKLFEDICSTYEGQCGELIKSLDMPQKEYAKDALYAYCGGNVKSAYNRLRLLDHDNKDFYKYRSAHKLVDKFKTLPVYDMGVWKLYSIFTGDIIIEASSIELKSWAKENDCLFRF